PGPRSFIMWRNLPTAAVLFLQHVLLGLAAARGQLPTQSDAQELVAIRELRDNLRKDAVYQMTEAQVAVLLRKAPKKHRQPDPAGFRAERKAAFDTWLDERIREVTDPRDRGNKIGLFAKVKAAVVGPPGREFGVQKGARERYVEFVERPRGGLTDV